MALLRRLRVLIRDLIARRPASRHLRRSLAGVTWLD